jgi:predicted Rossmann fold flavoprotein
MTTTTTSGLQSRSGRSALFRSIRQLGASAAVLTVMTFSMSTRVVSSLATTASKHIPIRIAVVGGGASGIFAAIAAGTASSSSSLTSPAASSHKKTRNSNQITVLEAGSATLTKVKISGGGRCNVLHDTSKAVPDLLQGYPRGKNELNGLFNSRFSPTMAQQFFEQRGVQLKTEADGRMFPTTDSSQTIIDTLLTAAEDVGVSVLTRCKVESIQKAGPTGPFRLSIVQKEGTEKVSKEVECDAVILATGSSPIGYQLAKDLGHSLVTTVPSLFTLNAKLDVKEGALLHELSGVSVPKARVSFRFTVEGKKKKKVIEQEGPLLITHHGLSGPAALRLSAFGARDFADANYRGDVVIHWAPSLGTADQVADALWRTTTSNPKKTVATTCPLLLEDGSGAIPRRLWSSMVLQAGFTKDTVWAEASKKLVRKLATQISECPIQMTGKGTFKEEFVTAGGISLKEIDMKTMQSKVCPGLYVCGELINVDGVTGGYNFMNCWGTGYVAGTSAATPAVDVEQQAASQ